MSHCSCSFCFSTDDFPFSFFLPFSFLFHLDCFPLTRCLTLMIDWHACRLFVCLPVCRSIFFSFFVLMIVVDGGWGWWHDELKMPGLREDEMRMRITMTDSLSFIRVYCRPPFHFLFWLGRGEEITTIFPFSRLEREWACLVACWAEMRRDEDETEPSSTVLL